ncbi:MAG: hypothetical protein WCB94_08085 [Terriglobales bacterium]
MIIDVSPLNARSEWPQNFVPKGWKLTRLGDEAEARLGKMLDKEKNRGELYPYLANPNVRWFDFELSSLKQMRFEADELEKYSICNGDILICEGGEAGRCAIWTGKDTAIKFQKSDSSCAMWLKNIQQVSGSQNHV